MASRTRRALAAGAAVVLLAAGCGDDDDPDVATEETSTTEGAADETEPSETEPSETEPSETESSGGGQAVEVTAVDYAYEGAPDELEAGLVELSFTNEGTVGHEFGLVELGDTDIDTFMTDFPPVLEGGPFPEYVDEVAVPADIDPGESVETSFLLTEGNYVLFCALDGKAPEDGATTTTGAEGGPPGEGETGPLHFTVGMIQPLSVTAGSVGELPEADSSIVAKDYGFDVDVKAGEQTVSFTNDGPEQIHHAVFFPFAEGVDAARAEEVLGEFLASEGSGPPPPELDFAAAEGLHDTGIFSTGLGQTITETFESGRTYAVVCFLSDRSGGPPHVVAHDMKEIFTVE